MINHVSIFLPRSTSFYEHLLCQIRSGFEQNGVRTSGACVHLESNEMREWCLKHQPDAVLEMNRPRCDVPFLKKAIKHIVWVVDLNGRPLDYFQGSDITYLFDPLWEYVFPHDGFHRWLAPGSCEKDYPPLIDDSYDVDVSFVGHMPRRWSNKELDRMITSSGDLQFRDILTTLESIIWERRNDPTSEKFKPENDWIHFADELCMSAVGSHLVPSGELKYDISGRIIRHLQRQELISTALNNTNSLRLYGPENWREWPEYAPFYAGYLKGPGQLGKAYRSSKINLHDGVGMHFRSVDCMSTGGLLFFREREELDRLPGEISTQFEPDREFVSFSPDTFPDKLKQYLGDPKRADQVRKAAARAIRAGHTWRHRAESVLKDLQQL